MEGELASKAVRWNYSLKQIFLKYLEMKVFTSRYRYTIPNPGFVPIVDWLEFHPMELGNSGAWPLVF